ncbi:protealysin inhibitor emfourin [Microbacterium sp. NPDC090007]|uniref:protealysin inhibitor emfourin n=1 Tax=Microbacterium sp. NPDC090007 TaxID=3364204 RepID=UPI0038216E32
MPQPETVDDERIVVTVVRSGGIAGLSKQWRAEPGPDDEPRWRELVERCPWDETPPPATGTDRYQWRIEVHRGAFAVRQARLGEAQVDGPWRALVDEVRDAAGSRPRRR